MANIIKKGITLLFILTAHIQVCFSQGITVNAIEEISVDSAISELSRIEEKVFTDNHAELHPQIEALTTFWEHHYETTGKLSPMHIYSYLLFAIHKFQLRIYEEDAKQKALEYCNKALSLLEENHISEHHPIYIYTENTKLWCHYFLNDYKSPYKEYEFPEWLPIIVNTNSFSSFHISNNQFKYESTLLTELCTSAEKYREQKWYHNELYYLLAAKELYNHVYKEKEDFYYFNIVNSIAKAYANLEEYEKAIIYLEDYCNYLSCDTVELSGSFKTMAEDCLEKCREKTEYGKQIKQQAIEYHNNNKIRKFQKEVETIKRYYGPNSNIYEISITKLAELYNIQVLKYFTKKRWNRVRESQIHAAKYTKEAIEVIKKRIHSHFPLITYDLRYQYSRQRLAWIENYLPLFTIFNGANTDSYETLYDALLLCKGLHWKSLAEMNMSISTDTMQSALDTLVHAAKYDYMDFINYTWKDITKNMKEDMVAIEFFNFKMLEKEVYSASIIRHDSKKPKFVNIFSKKEFDTISPTNYYNTDSLYNLVWKRLEPYITPGDKIYFSPSGVLNNVSIESTMDSTGMTASSKWDIYRVSSTREIIKSKNKIASKPSAVMYGWINYDQIDSITIPSCTYEYGEDESSEAREALFHGSYKSLPYTKFEIEEISELLETHSIPFITYEHGKATEESFKSLSGKGNSIIHIATHGFYWREESKTDIYDTLNNDSLVSTLDESMKRSGLLFSGVNQALNDSTASHNFNDGILTAYEISKLDLRGCDLVVLSACETALGDIYTAEGVYGLQRGFKLAGANSILMSLWKVDDAATRMLMTEFYRNLLNGMSKRESLLKAQDAVRNFRGVINGEIRSFSNPRYWAGFVLLDGIEPEK